ncbi:hypothetical protein [Kaistella palustris]|uniref:hypothetical protein n=1 Tax=Kaistella palustris TaxID=493376 RepID=UPI0004813BAC|nr:hypothetical protein [Kaistella palustris]
MRTLLFFAFFLMVSCNDKDNKTSTSPGTKPLPDAVSAAKTQDSLLIKWTDFYKKENPDFNAESFELQETVPISFAESSVKILNEKGFNEIYKPFLIFNKSGNQYLDFDSYHWFAAKDGFASFSADQEVALIDLKAKSARQIAFLGPSYQVEEAYWKGDSVAVILGNSSEKIPFKTEFNFNNNTRRYFKYPDTLNFASSYYQSRLKGKGIKTDQF